MNYFRYKLLTPEGKVVGGVVQLPYRTAMSAANHLERDGNAVLLVRPLGPVGQLVMRAAGWRLRRRLARPLLAEMLANMALMLRSGMPLVTAVQEAAQMSGSRAVATDLKDLNTAIAGGATFSEAAAKYPHIFPPTVIHLIRMGEETGRLDKMLADAAEHIKRVHEIISDTKQALLYPALVFVAIGAGLIFWLYAVVPKIVALFKDMGVVLPAITVGLVAVSTFVQEHILALLAGALVTVVVVGAGRRGSRRFKKATEKVLLLLPVVKNLVVAANLAFISEYFSMLLSAGIDLLQSMKIVIESVGNEVYRDKLAEVREVISRGEGIAEAFGRAGIFPSFVVRMVAVGESSGSLTDQLETVAEEYRRRLRVLVATLGKLIEPVVLVIAGAVFAVIISALLLPIYDLLSQISG